MFFVFMYSSSANAIMTVNLTKNSAAEGPHWASEDRPSRRNQSETLRKGYVES